MKSKLWDESHVTESYWNKNTCGAVTLALLIIASGTFFMYENLPWTNYKSPVHGDWSFVYFILAVILLLNLIDIYLHKGNRWLHVFNLVFTCVMGTGIALWVQGKSVGNLQLIRAGVVMIWFCSILAGIGVIKRSKERASNTSRDAIAAYNNSTDGITTEVAYLGGYGCTDNITRDRRYNKHMGYTILIVLGLLTWIGFVGAQDWTYGGLGWNRYYIHIPLFVTLVFCLWLSILDMLPVPGDSNPDLIRKKMYHGMWTLWWILVIGGTFAFIYGYNNSTDSAQATGDIALYLALLIFVFNYVALVHNRKKDAEAYTTATTKASPNRSTLFA